MNAGDIIVRFMLQRFVEGFKRELTSETRWEADPRTRTIRRRKPTTVSSSTRPTTTSSREVLDVCPYCFAVMAVHGPGGACPTD